MLLENIPIGKTLEIFVDRDDFRYRLVSKVEDVNAFRVCVTAITSRGRFFQFRSSDRIRLVYRDEQVMWEWDFVRAGLEKLGNMPVHYLQIKDKGKSFNRRGAYRLKILEYANLQYYVVPGEKNTAAEIPEVSVADMDHMSQEQKDIILDMTTPREEKCMIKDISESGMGLYADKMFSVGDEMSLEVNTSYGPLPIKASVVRNATIEEKDIEFKYLIGCELTEADQRLIRYIYDLQRKLLRQKKFTSSEKQEWEKERIEKEKERKKRAEETKKRKLGIKKAKGELTKEQWDNA